MKIIKCIVLHILAYIRSFYGFASRFSVAIFSLGIPIIFSTYTGHLIADLAGKVTKSLQEFISLFPKNIL